MRLSFQRDTGQNKGARRLRRVNAHLGGDGNRAVVDEPRDELVEDAVPVVAHEAVEDAEGGEAEHPVLVHIRELFYRPPVSAVYTPLTHSRRLQLVLRAQTRIVRFAASKQIPVRRIAG